MFRRHSRLASHWDGGLGGLYDFVRDFKWPPAPSPGSGTTKVSKHPHCLGPSGSFCLVVAAGYQSLCLFLVLGPFQSGILVADPGAWGEESSEAKSSRYLILLSPYLVIPGYCSRGGGVLQPGPNLVLFWVHRTQDHSFYLSLALSIAYPHSTCLVLLLYLQEIGGIVIPIPYLLRGISHNCPCPSPLGVVDLPGV